MRLRRKLTLAFFAVSSLVSVLLAVFLYRFIERELKAELRGRLRDVTHIGAHLLDTEAYRRLVDQLRDGANVDTIEHSDDYRRLYEQLRLVRSSEPELIKYSYLVAPVPDADHPRYVVDADVLELRQAQARGALGADEKISHFNAPVEDIASIPRLHRALRDCTPQIEEAFVFDKEFNVNSVSAYVPLGGPQGVPLRDAAGRCLGVLGVDITDKNMRAALDAAGGLAIRISLAVIGLALVVSIVFGTILSRSIRALSATVTRFADKDFSARSAVHSRDEIGQLGDNFNQMAATIQLHSDHLEELVRQRTQELIAEKATSERLLRNVLPGPIADRLKTGTSLIVDRFEAVSVLFADIVGFTNFASRTSPEALVTMLNELFSLFDRLAERHGLEKIKTIGDAYMVVAGVPEPVADHAVAIAHMALDMMKEIDAYAARTGSALTIRCGIHTGSVVAGVIGEKKFIYDLWGDTVNTASRMESSGLPGKIQVTEPTYHLLKDHFELVERGMVDVKGKGAMKTYLLVGQRRELSVEQIAG